MPKVIKGRLKTTKAATLLASLRNVQKKKKKFIRVTAVINNLAILTKKVETLETRLACTEKENEKVKQISEMRFETIKKWICNVAYWKQYMMSWKNQLVVSLSSNNAWRASVEARSMSKQEEHKEGLEGMKEQVVALQTENKKLKVKLRLQQRKESLKKRLS